MAVAAPLGGVTAEAAASDLVIVRESDVITEDLYAAGERVIVRGRIEGDLIAASFNDVTIEGVVEGDVLAVAQEINITGEVLGSVRVLAGTVTMDGEIRDDLAVAALRSHIGGSTGRDVLGFGWDLEVPGDVGRELRAQMATEIGVAGTIGADAEVNARTIVVSGFVGGDLRYRGDLELAETAQVAGLTTELGRLPVPIRVRALLLGATILSLLSVVGLGALAIWLAPRVIQRAAEVAKRPWLGLGVGVVSLVVPPIVMGAFVASFAVTSADLTVPALLAVAPVAAAYLAAVALAVLVGFVPASTSIGRFFWRRPQPPTLDFLAGAAFWVVLSLVRPLGLILIGIGLIAGMGSVIVGAWRLRAEPPT